MRDRLIELIDRAGEECKHTKDCSRCSGYGKGASCMNYHGADYLLANGVIVPPVRVGQDVCLLLERMDGSVDIVRSQCVRVTSQGCGLVFSMFIDCPEIGNSLEYRLDDFGKSVFLTREAAEQALKGGAE